ncbi:MAG: hypothetical protein FJ290_20160 [Planctomycetes bacterium]|nr:hypothetical protein [Planctomycetota bacterium]
MTLAVSWVRKVGSSCEELVVAADSRLGGGMKLDCCPKILLLPRSDSFICFAGDTAYAYPLMLQLSMAIQAYGPSLDRAMDIHDMRGHALKVFNKMRDSVHDYVEGMDEPDTSFILGGYSWVRKAFSLWLIHYKATERMFTYRPARNLLPGFPSIVLLGDCVREARRRLVALLNERHHLGGDCRVGGTFDMEPFEVLRDILREGRYDTVGGPPQIAKVYQHMNCRPVAVYWPDRSSGSVYLHGRPLLQYEHSNYWILDPETLKTTHPAFSQFSNSVG